MTDPIPTFSYLVSRLAKDHPNLAYLHVVNVGFSGDVDDGVVSGEVGLLDLRFVQFSGLTLSISPPVK